MKITILSLGGKPRTETLEELNKSYLTSLVKKKGDGKITRIIEYPEYDIVGYGWDEGKHSNINKVELAPPYDKEFFYGEIILFKKNRTDFTKTDYKKFYEDIHQGFETLGEEDTDASYNTEEEDLDWKPEDFVENKSCDYSDYNEYSYYTSEEEKESVDCESWNFNQSDTEEEYI